MAVYSNIIISNILHMVHLSDFLKWIAIGWTVTSLIRKKITVAGHIVLF